MTFLISLFSPEDSRISATGSWQVTADNADQSAGNGPILCGFPILAPGINVALRSA